MEKYVHKVHYYETDRMGVTHHSNYIRWMEEARVYFLEQVGLGYSKFEQNGIVSPVIGIKCDYKKTTTFDDEIIVDVKVKEFKGVKLIVEYIMTNAKTGEIVFTGVSKHCFLNNDSKPVILKKEFPIWDKRLRELQDKNK